MSIDLRPPLSRGDYDTKINELEGLIASLGHDLDLAKKQLGWMREGRSLFFPDEGPHASETITAPNGTERGQSAQTAIALQGAATQVNPGGGTTLRHAVLTVFTDRPPINGMEPSWRAAEVIAELRRRDAMPNSAEHGEAIVRKMLRNMANRGEIVRRGYGDYALADGVRATGGTGPKRGPGDLQRQVMRILEAGGEVTPSDIFDSLVGAGMTANKGSIHNALARLAGIGVIERSRPGRWRLANRSGGGDREI